MSRATDNNQDYINNIDFSLLPKYSHSYIEIVPTRDGGNSVLIKRRTETGDDEVSYSQTFGVNGNPIVRDNVSFNRHPSLSRSGFLTGSGRDNELSVSSRRDVVRSPPSDRYVEDLELDLTRYPYERPQRTIYPEESRSVSPVNPNKSRLEIEGYLPHEEDTLFTRHYQRQRQRQKGQFLPQQESRPSVYNNNIEEIY